jgi:hypothetical protein
MSGITAWSRKGSFDRPRVRARQARITQIAALILILVSVFGWSHPASAQGKAAEYFDVLGIKLGMPIGEAQKILMEVYKDQYNEQFTTIHSANPVYADNGPPGSPSLRSRYRANNGTLVVVSKNPDTLGAMMDRARQYDSGQLDRDEVSGEIKRWQNLTDKIVLDLRGTTNAETVAVISRGTVFPQGHEPTLASLSADLKTKYGVDPSRESPDHFELVWYYDTRNRLIKEGTPNWRNDCVNLTGLPQDLSRSDPALPTGAREDCGFFIRAAMRADPANPALVSYLNVNVVDNGLLFSTLKGREEYFAAIKADQQKKQIEDAQKNTAKPAL